MKFYGIFRGFAGLGRVVSGIGIIDRLKSEGHDVRVFTYAQGLTIASDYGFHSLPVIGDNDIGFMGIVPISPTGLSIADDILEWQPDCVIIDGEPLMTECLRLAGINGKIVALVNPLDLHSEQNNPVTMNYFRHLFSQADMLLCHGLANVNDKIPENIKKKVYCLNTILRDEIFTIKRDKPQFISCILGGGTKNCATDFVDSTLEIAKRVMLIAENRKDYNFNIYCNDFDIGIKIDSYNRFSNVKVIKKYVSPVEIYENSKLVIGRAGRNTISELLYLKIPAIVVSILGNIVSIEQNNNIKLAFLLSNGNIIGHSLNEDASSILRIFDLVVGKNNNYDDWICGNSEAYMRIKQLVENK